MEKEENKNKRRIATSVGLLFLVVFIIGLTYAAFTYAQKGNKTNTITTGVISMSYDTEEENGISLTNAMPISDKVGKAQIADEAVFDFTVSINASSSTKVTYEVTAEKTAGDLENSAVKLYLTRSTSSTGTYTAVAEPSVYTKIAKTDELGATSGEMRLDSGVVSAVTTYYYQLRMWIDDDYEIGETAKSFSAKVNVYGKNGNITLTSGITGVASQVVTSLLATNSDTMIKDGTTDNNIRYTGANPNNYVTFNGEKAGWRIVGVFGNNVKLVRKGSIGNWSWDSSESTVNSGYGVNDWTQADLMKTLNSEAYWNRIKGTCYNGQNNATGECDFSSTSSTPGLTSDAKNMIASTTWNLGGWNTSAILTSAMYGYERGTTVWGSTSEQTCNDGACPRKTTWTGKVGLLYPSDYGYASSACYNSKKLELYDTSCNGSNWLFNGDSEWLLTSTSRYANATMYIGQDGHIGDGVLSRTTYSVRPTLYLNSTVKITEGSGTSSDPYQLSAS